MATLEIIRKRRRIKMRFRGIIRVIICRNLAQVELENEDFTDNLQRNVVTFIRRQTPFSMLTKEERLIFGKPNWIRTNEERRKLVQVIASLECFNSYPPKVRARLTPYLYFMRIEPGRILVKEGQRPTTLYFILNGECVYSKLVYDSMTRQIVNKNMFIAGPGDVVGLPALVNRTRRFRTVTVLKNMEVLCLEADEFYKFLYPSAKFQHDQMIAAIKKFEVLNSFDEQQKHYAVQFGVLKEFQPMETIYFQENSGMKYTYFILNGQCMILHSLKIRVKQVNATKVYELCDEETEETEEVEEESSDKLMRSEHIVSHTPGRKRAISIRISADGTDSDTESNKLAASTSKFISSCPQEIAEIGRRVTKAFEIESEIPEVEEVYSENIESDVRFITPTRSKKKEPKWKYETHFVDVGTLSFGSIFGLGETMSRRSIMARTVVQCYMLPRFWLLDKPQNPGNIWQQMRFHLDSTIPSEQKIFEDYLATQKWVKLKTSYINSLLEPKDLTCKIQDIPVYCRIIETDIK